MTIVSATEVGADGSGDWGCETSAVADVCVVAGTDAGAGAC